AVDAPASVATSLTVGRRATLLGTRAALMGSSCGRGRTSTPNRLTPLDYDSTAEEDRVDPMQLVAIGDDHVCYGAGADAAAVGRQVGDGVGHIRRGHGDTGGKVHGAVLHGLTDAEQDGVVEAGGVVGGDGVHEPFPHHGEGEFGAVHQPPYPEAVQCGHIDDGTELAQRRGVFQGFLHGEAVVVGVPGDQPYA